VPGALLVRGGEGLWAPSLHPGEAERAPQHLHCPVERLIRGPHLIASARADWLLRSRIYSAEPLSPSGWGLVKVGAKRHSVLSEGALSAMKAMSEAEGVVFKEVSLPPPALISRRSERPFHSMREASAWLLDQTEAHNDSLLKVGEGQTSPLLPHHGVARRWTGARRAVGALLLDGALRPWGLAFKQPERHPLYHAEWALLDALLRERPSLGGPLTLITTLKPCKMCAGAWVSYGPRPLRVCYISDDPGKMGQNTALDVGSFAWREAGELTVGCHQAHGVEALA